VITPEEFVAEEGFHHGNKKLLTSAMDGHDRQLKN
jgi:hypothetical protein